MLSSWKGALFWGFVIWVIPFVVSVAFYSPQGVLLIDEHSFNTIMVVVGTAIGAIATVMYFKKVERNFACEGVRVGMLWMVMSWVFDVAILVPMGQMSLPAYFSQIGLQYLSILMMTVAIGAVLECRIGKCAPAAKPARKRRK